uniref:ATP-dependent Clp protease proteolytic subunit n=1 Tax=Dilkea retusa TaxID=697065 RepID=A0A7H0TVM4_9ROSI|nr:ClpP [Dilkea retusa]QNR05076.1 ClpP [Dilkea retusa]
MPIGVPKVPFRLPGEEDATWVDTGLYNQRILFLCQEVNSEISNQIAGLLIYLNIEDPTREFFLFINSPGGWILPGMTIYNTMEMVNSDVRTICTGIAASMASFVLVAGDSFKRLAFPNVYHQGNDPSTAWCFFGGKHKRTCHGNGRTNDHSGKHRQNLCTKNGPTLRDHSRRPGKGFFYVSNRSPSSWNC